MPSRRNEQASNPSPPIHKSGHFFLSPFKIASGHASQGFAGFQRRHRSCRIPKSTILNRQSSFFH
jgi:hypothetical protein